MSIGIKHTRELVADAVVSCTSLSEVIARFGGKLTTENRAYLRKQRLREVVRESTRIAEVLRSLGISSVASRVGLVEAVRV